MAESGLVPFELIEHPSEVGILARGRSLEELFANAALALYSVMVPLEDVETSDSHDLQAEATDLESLLVAWLTELLFLFDTEGWLGRRVLVHEVSATRARGEVGGEPADRARHHLRLGIKAVTYHQLRVEHTAAGWEAQCVLDV